MQASYENQVAALTVVGLGGLMTVPIFRSLVREQDREFLLKLVVAGLLLRVGLGIIVHVELPVGFFAPDQYTFQDVGWRALQYERGEGPRPSQIADTLEVGYFYWNSFLFMIFGFAPLAAKIANCFFGAWSAIVAYRIGGELAGRGTALNAGMLVMLFPSLVLWSTQNIRDTLVLFLLSVLLLLFLRAQLRVRPGRIIWILFLLALLPFLRDYMAVMVLLSLLGSLLVSPARRLPVNVMIALMLIGLAITAYDQLGLGDELLSFTNFERLDQQRQALAQGGSAFQPDVDISDPMRGLQYLPVGIAFFLLAPFPWQIGSVLSLMTLPEMVVWYLLLPFVVYGGLFLLKNRFRRVQPIALFVLLTTATYGLVEGNAGTAYRHRAQIVLFLLIIAGVGLHVWSSRRTKQQEANRRRTATMWKRPLRK